MLECIELLLANLNEVNSINNQFFIEFVWLVNRKTLNNLMCFINTECFNLRKEFCPSILCYFGKITLNTKLNGSNNRINTNSEVSNKLFLKQIYT